MDKAGEIGRSVSFAVLDDFLCSLDEEDLARLIEYLASTILAESQSDEPIFVTGKASIPTVGYQLELKYHEVKKETADLLIASYHHQISEREWLMLQRIAHLLGTNIRVDHVQDQKRVQLTFPANQSEEK